MDGKLDTIEKVRAYIKDRRDELVKERKRHREEGDTMQAYEATGCALELGDLLALLPPPPVEKGE